MIKYKSEGAPGTSSPHISISDVLLCLVVIEEEVIMAEMTIDETVATYCCVVSVFESCYPPKAEGTGRLIEHLMDHKYDSQLLISKICRVSYEKLHKLK